MSNSRGGCTPRLPALALLICFCSLPPLKTRQMRVLITAQEKRQSTSARELHSLLVSEAGHSHHSTVALTVPMLLPSLHTAFPKLCMGKITSALPRRVTASPQPSLATQCPISLPPFFFFSGLFAGFAGAAQQHGVLKVHFPLRWLEITP